MIPPRRWLADLLWMAEVRRRAPVWLARGGPWMYPLLAPGNAFAALPPPGPRLICLGPDTVVEASASPVPPGASVLDPGPGIAAASAPMRTMARHLARGLRDPLDLVAGIHGAQALRYDGDGGGWLSRPVLGLLAPSTRTALLRAARAGAICLDARHAERLWLPGIGGGTRWQLGIRHTSGTSARQGTGADCTARRERDGRDELLTFATPPGGQSVHLWAVSAQVTTAALSLPPLYPEHLPSDPDPLDAYAETPA